MPEILYAGHRERMRERFAKTAGDGFSDHELLETLLSYSICEGNANDAAHRLLRYFGSLEGVLCASADELITAENVGEATAVLIKAVFDIHLRMQQDDVRQYYKSFEDVGELFVKKFRHVKTETMVLLLFDKRGRINREAIIATGSTDRAVVDMKKLVSSSVSADACYAAAAHNHLSGILRFSFDDECSAVNINDALRNLGIKLIDYYVVADGGYKGIFNDSFHEISR